MKKLSIILSLIVFGQLAFGQAVHDRNVIPVAVNLNQVLRMTITNGGNIEFTFNTVEDYRLGLSAEAALQNPQDADATGNPANDAANTGVGFYTTDFVVASSTDWMINWGAENGTFIGTDDPNNTLLTLDNVGFRLDNNAGTHDFEATAAKAGTADAELYSAATNNTVAVTALEQYPAVSPLIEDNDDPNFSNAGDITDNSFTLYWRCGTTEDGSAEVPVIGATVMNAVSILNQGDIVPDRYVVNVIFELATDTP